MRFIEKSLCLSKIMYFGNARWLIRGHVPTPCIKSSSSLENSLSRSAMIFCFNFFLFFFICDIFSLHFHALWVLCQQRKKSNGNSLGSHTNTQTRVYSENEPGIRSNFFYVYFLVSLFSALSLSLCCFVIFLWFCSCCYFIFSKLVNFSYQTFRISLIHLDIVCTILGFLFCNFSLIVFFFSSVFSPLAPLALLRV